MSDYIRTLSDLPCNCKYNHGDLCHYFSKNDILLGVLCNLCNTEFLRSPEYDNLPGVSHAHPVFKYHDVNFRIYKPKEVKVDNTFQVQPFRTPIENVEVIKQFLQEGDHIAWHRSYVIWHHAIVADVNNELIEIIEFNNSPESQKFKREASVITTIIDLTTYQSRMMEDGRLFRMDYPKEVLKANPRELVVARARSRVGDFLGMYRLLTKNCETLATFCRTGLAKCHQTEWFKEKIREHAVASVISNLKPVLNKLLEYGTKGVGAVITAILPKLGTNSVPFAEAVESIIEYTSKLTAAEANTIGVVLALVVEFLFCLRDVWRIYKAEWNGDMTSEDRGETVRKRIYEALFSILPSIFVSLGFESLMAGFLTLFGVTTGGTYILLTLAAAVFGGFVGRAVGQMAGSMWGSYQANQKLKNA